MTTTKIKIIINAFKILPTGFRAILFFHILFKKGKVALKRNKTLLVTC